MANPELKYSYIFRKSTPLIQGVSGCFGKVATVLALLAGTGLLGSSKAASSPAATVKTAAPTASMAGPAPAAAASKVPVAEPGTLTRTYRLGDLGGAAALEFRGIDHSVYLPLSVRLDESVVHARLHLRYTFSPALLPELSHLRVAVHDETLGTLVAQKNKLGTPQEAELELDPRHFTEYAKLRLQFIGHYTLDCEFPFHTSLWAQLASASTLVLVTRPLPLRNDLALLPAPFFDARDASRLELPFVFAARPGTDTLRGAGVLASWFGALAAWRGAQFPALLDELPAGHAVVFATNAERPRGLTLAPVEQPTLSVISHPNHPTAKLLLVQGRDGEQLVTAARALALGQAVLSGPSVQVSQLDLPPRRGLHDAPNIQPGGALVRLGDLQKQPGQLEVAGNTLDMVRVPLRLPADIVTWEARGLPVNLRYRYTPPTEEGTARLAVQVNNQLVQAFPLRVANSTLAGGERLVLPFLETGGAVDRQDLTVPAFQLGANNQLQFRFDIVPANETRCRNTLLGSQAAIDPDSTIDLRFVEHFAVLPNLAMYANSGFPYTRYADLAETAVILPDQARAGDVTTALTALGQFGAVTGTPGTRVQVLPASRAAEASDRDLLVISSADAPPLLQGWSKSLPAVLGEQARASSPLRLFTEAGAEWFGGAAPRKRPDAGWAQLRGAGPLGALMGFESPLRAGRSVVVLQATDESSLAEVRQLLLDPAKLARVQGDLVLVRAGQVDAFRVGSTYEVGSLAWWRWVWFQLHQRPLLLVALAGLFGLLVALPVYRSLRLRAQRRLQA
ncbi:MAG: hypothetical protein RLZZ584_1344 [Pseudomonadota bacterium]